MREEELLKYQNILLLQGPKGWFFYKLGKYFKNKGKVVYKINFNGGDLITYPDFKNSFNFTDKIENWPEFLTNFLENKKIDVIFLYGDYKPYHRIAIDIARKRNIDVYVFEEGYVRPYYITMEKWGINGFSSLPKDPSFYLNLPDIEIPEPQPTEFSYIRQQFSRVVHYVFLELFRWKFRHYVPYKNYFPYVSTIFCFLRGLIRKGLYKFKDKKIFHLLKTELSKKYFLVALQCHNDSQIKIHSKYNSVEEFIEEVIKSFARHACKEHYLVFKHHPVDRGFKHYEKFIRKLAKEHEIEKRIFYVHDLHLPTLIKNSLGVVVVNSTVGLQALWHNIPVKTMGKAIYDIEGLTFQGTLDDFWKNPGEVDKNLFKKFYNYVIKTTQLNGSFYGRFPFKF